MISLKDKAILRNLAKKQLEIANSEKNIELAELWKKHNMLKGVRPMIHIEIDTFQQDVIEPMLQCSDKFARQIEYSIYSSFVNQESFNDDKPVPPYFPVGWHTWFKLFGHSPNIKYAENNLAFRIDYIISNLEDEYSKLGKTEFGVDNEATEVYKSKIEDIIGDILPVKMSLYSLCASPTQNIVFLMGMENMFTTMIINPEKFLIMMNRVADDYTAYFKYLEQGGYLLPTTSYEPLIQGSFCFTDELPSSGKLTTRDLWGYMDSQETVGVSPEMFKELIFPCYKSIASNFGLLSYGCCEPVHQFWSCLKTMDNLRKISISPWCNEEYMGEQLRGTDIIYFRKPSPNLIGLNREMDEEMVQSHIYKTLRAAKGCKLEFAQRDVYTIYGNIGKVRRYVEIIRQCVENEWQP